MSLAFHATPPPGEWINDPNGLVFAGGAWRLFVQHRADAPAFRATGWARLSSPDLLRWSWDGPVIPADGDAWAYSGSVTGDGHDLGAFHTEHRDGHETQRRRASTDAGLSWVPLPAVLPDSAAGANARDPFVFDANGDWHMLLAHPCPWHGWAGADASRLAVLRSPDRRTWQEAGSIGPWSPPGVMWEVPVLIRASGRDLLLVSLVDRRDDGADCAVHAWAGELTEAGFAIDDGWPATGHRVDLGPDFYAAMPGEGRVVAWLASWATARTVAWPGFAGGPISLARRLTLACDRVVHEVAPEIETAFAAPVARQPEAGCGRFEVGARFALTIASPSVRLTVTGVDGAVEVRREGGGLDWRCRHDGRAMTGPARLFVDGPAVELFAGGEAVSAAVPGGVLTVGGADIAWSVLT